MNRTHAGPLSALCAQCGVAIGAYQSRWYGNDGAVHVWKPGTVERADCLTPENKHKYPHYYTDG